MAVEEEFAILDRPRSSSNRFEELQAGAEGTPLAEHLVGELIASEIEIRTGKCETFAEAAAAMAERRRQLLELAGRFDVLLGATGTHPWSRWQDQRIIDTPHYRRNDEILRYVVWRNNSFGLHIHMGVRTADRGPSRRRAAHVPAAPARLLRQLSVRRGRQHLPPLGAHGDLYADVPALRDSRCVGSWHAYEDYVRFLYGTGSITEHTQIWWSARPHLALPSRSGSATASPSSGRPRRSPR